MSSDTSTGAQGQGGGDGGAVGLSRDELRAAVAAMSDADLCEFVIAVSANRPKLHPLHQVAQLSAIAGPLSSDDAELANVRVSAAGGTVASSDFSDVPVGEVPALDAPGGRAAADEDAGWTKEGIPTFAAVRDRIAARFAVAIGASETVVHQAEDRSLEQQWETRARLARERLEQIKGIMRK